MDKADKETLLKKKKNPQRNCPPTKFTSNSADSLENKTKQSKWPMFDLTTNQRKTFIFLLVWPIL